MRNFIWIIVASWSVLAAQGCGYHLQGATAPEAAIEVHIFENRTIETGIEALITDRILEELRRTPGWRIVPEGRGRYALKGVVHEFVSEPHLVSRRHLAEEHRATIFLEVTFQDRSQGKTLWREPELKAFEDYTVGSDILGNERRKRAAVGRIAEELATRIRVHIQDTW